jgi:hypothetical protein
LALLALALDTPAAEVANKERSAGMVRYEFIPLEKRDDRQPRRRRRRAGKRALERLGVSAVNGIGAPKNTPAEIVDKLNREINAGQADPKLKVRLADLGASVLVGSPVDYGKLIAEETEKWGKVIRAANIKPD